MDENIYAAPKSEMQEESKFSQFGGWLRCYQVLNIVGMVSMVFVIIIMLLFMIADGLWSQDTIDLYAIFFEAIPIAALSVVTLRILTRREIFVPSQIKMYLNLYLTVSIVFFAILYVIHSSGYITDKPTPVLGDIIYYYSWSSYFKKSKRVNAYYGTNAT